MAHKIRKSFRYLSLPSRDISNPYLTRERRWRINEQDRVEVWEGYQRIMVISGALLAAWVEHLLAGTALQAQALAGFEGAGQVRISPWLIRPGHNPLPPALRLPHESPETRGRLRRSRLSRRSLKPDNNGLKTG